MADCQCCFCPVPFETMCQCSEGCLFCKDCLQQYAQTTIFGEGKRELKCCNAGEPCVGMFPVSLLRLVLPPNLMERFDERLQEEDLAVACQDLVTCHKCKFRAALEDKTDVFVCPRNDCHARTCRECGREAHPNLTCAQATPEAEGARKRIEEAATQALVRECPRCKARFFKEDGCNKMTCRCGCLSCYLCRKDITKEGYAHFCQTPLCNHSTCKKCLLFTNTVQDDQAAIARAQHLAATAALQERPELRGVIAAPPPPPPPPPALSPPPPLRHRLLACS